MQKILKISLKYNLKGLWALSLVLLFFSSLYSQTIFNEIVVFGDSLSDVGRVNGYTLGASPGSNYYQGRYSNGLLAVDRINSQMGFSSLTPRSGTNGVVNTQGNNFAVGGASTKDDNLTQSGMRPPSAPSNLGFQSQVTDYLNSSQTKSADKLVFAWIGGNDMVRAFATGSQASALTYLDDSLSRMSSSLNSLVSAGSTSIFVPNLINMAYVPLYASQSSTNLSLLTSLTQYWNQGLSNIVTGINQPQVQLFDTYTLFNTIYQNPSTYGIEQVTGRGIDHIGSLDDYLFYDSIHPGALGHEILGNAMFQKISAIPEPSTYIFSLISFAGIIFLFLRSRVLR